MKPFDSTELRSSLRNNVPPSMREAYAKVVNAGMKIMFDKSTHKFMQQQMAAEGEIDDKLAEGVGQLMGMLLQNSKGAFPQQLIIPAGIELMMHAADYAAQTGQDEVTPDLMASAIQKFVFALFGQAKVSPDMLLGGIDKIASLHQQGGGQEPPPEQGGMMAPQPQPGA